VNSVTHIEAQVIKLSKKTNGHKFYRANVELLEKAIQSTGKFPAKIASEGGLSRDTLKTARSGGRITSTKAHGICKGLNACECNPHAEISVLFPYGED
jgi:hypothetical protein